MYDIIVNPLGGKGKTSKAIKSVKKILKQRKVEYTLHKTEYAGHAKNIAAELSKKPDTKIVVMGGDGSFHEVLCGISNFDNVTLGLIACGSGNDFIKKSGHSIKPEEALKVILKGDTKYFDYIEMGKYRCLNVAGGGMDVDVLLKYATCKKLKGKAAYYYSLLCTLLNTRFHKLRLTIDDVVSEKNVFMIGIGNGGFIGGGIQICPNAVPDDGILNVVVANELPKRKILYALLKLLKARHINESFVEEFNAKEVKIEILDDSLFELDGEIIEDKLLNCSVVHGKLKIFA